MIIIIINIISLELDVGRGGFGNGAWYACSDSSLRTGTVWIFNSVVSRTTMHAPAI